MIHTVLVVDDYEPWRRHIREELQRNPRFRIIGETADGFDAVRAAQTLLPDLIVLDIGLPSLSGLEVARRVLSHRPGTGIVFLTEERSPQIADAALATGARGYLIKLEDASALVAALEAVVNSGRFISPSLAGHELTSTRAWMAARTHRHEAGFYADEDALLDDYARMAAEALGAGNPFVVVAESGRRRRLQVRLQARGTDVRGAIKDGRYLSLDVAPEVSRLMSEGMPDDDSFHTAANALLDASMIASTAAHPRVAICGECSPGLWKAGLGDAAVRLEHLWDELAKSAAIDVLCGYLVDVPRLDDDGYAIFQRLCAEHETVHVR